MTTFWDQIRQPSYRGVKFFPLAGNAQFGRRNAVHEYPFRDKPWVEDLGMAARRFQVVGEIVGDDVIAQRARMIAAVEATGDGELTHPTFGTIQVALLGFEVEEDERGRRFGFRFTFVRQGQRAFPKAVVSGKKSIAAASNTVDDASASTYQKATQDATSNGATFSSQTRVEATAWARDSQRTATDPVSLLYLGASLPGYFGRRLGGPSSFQVVPPSRAAAPPTLQSLIGLTSVQRGEAAVATSTMIDAAGNISAAGTKPFIDSVQAVAAATLAAASTLSDALRGLVQLAQYAPSVVAVGAARVAQLAAADLFRRAALAVLAVAGSNYQPSSSDDALAVRTLVLDILDAEITVAGDQGEDDMFIALRALRALVVQDLNVRGAGLPSLVTVETQACLPSLVLAQRLYRDPTRADELVQRANPIHPAFMPTSFKALNK